MLIHRDESGQAVYILAIVMMVALIGIATVVVGLGEIYAVRGDVNHALQSAAEAGAVALTSQAGAAGGYYQGATSSSAWNVSAAYAAAQQSWAQEVTQIHGVNYGTAQFSLQGNTFIASTTATLTWAGFTDTFRLTAEAQVTGVN